MENETPDTTVELEAVKAQLAAAQTQLGETAAAVLGGVPDHLKALIPASLAPADQIAWFNTAKATGVFAKPAVPTTDNGTKPTVTPIAPDLSSLPTYARMAAGYRK